MSFEDKGRENDESREDLIHFHWGGGGWGLKYHFMYK